MAAAKLVLPSNAEMLVAHGALVDITVTADPDYDAPRKVSGRALIDTGATASALDQSIIAMLALPQAGTVEIGSAGGTIVRPAHAGFVHVDALGTTVRGSFAAVDLAGAPYIALLGRTFLRHFKLTYDGRTGEVLLEDGKPAAVRLVPREGDG